MDVYRFAAYANERVNRGEVETALPAGWSIDEICKLSLLLKFRHEFCLFVNQYHIPDGGKPVQEWVVRRIEVE